LPFSNLASCVNIQIYFTGKNNFAMDEYASTQAPSDLVIRFATKADLPHVAQIARITWDATYRETIAAENRQEFLERSYKVENLASSVDAPGHWFYVAETKGRVIGFGHFLHRYHPSQPRAELVRLYVLPEYQHAGIGTAILKTGFAALAQANIEQCFVSVQATNAPARSFYEKHGFTFHQNHGQFLGTQIVVMAEYIRPIMPLDSISTNPILTYLKTQQEAMVTMLAQWVNQDSPTYDKAAVDTMGRMIADAYIEAGGDLASVHPQVERGDHYTITYGEADRQILILCHFDTVWPLGEAQRRPFTIEAGQGKGPGVHDMKGGTLMGLFALKAIQQLGLKPRHKLVFLLTSDEEVGSQSSRALIEAEARQSSYCLVLEGSRSGPLTTWRKGVGQFHLEVTGLAAHAGIEPEKGASAIEELARQIQALHALTNLERGITVNIGVISGGERPNIVAPYASAELDLRVMTQADGEAMTAKILGLQPQVAGCYLKVTGGMNRWPFEETPAGLALFAKAQAIAQELGFSVDKIGSGGGSDGNFTAALGVPTLDGLGSLGGGAHALAEYTVLEALPLRAALLAELMVRL
jgi:glutamate carboxypeptidase